MTARSAKKIHGVVYTPEFLVRNILNLSGYIGSRIRERHAIDCSCGEGAFLCEVVDRYCRVCSEQGASRAAIKRELETYVHGRDIDREALGRCAAALDSRAAEYGVRDVRWDVKRADSVRTKRFEGMMDYVVGNPPYVRIHNWTNAEPDLKERYLFARSGMADLYLVFFERGLKMLKPGGALGYITPVSWFSSTAGARMREYFVRERLLSAVVGMKHYRAFGNAATYTAITVLRKGAECRSTAYYEYDERNRVPIFSAMLSPDDFWLDDKFYFAERNRLTRLREILNCRSKSGVTVKNGLATLCDSVFVARTFPFESRFIIPVVKASKGETRQLIFPYDASGNPVPEEILKQDEPLWEYLLSRRDRLLGRSMDRIATAHWYAYGRSQGVADVPKEKLSMNVLVRDAGDLKILPVPPGVGVYGGFIVLSRRIPLETVRERLLSEDFAQYVALLGKYKSGGYCAYSSKDVMKYADYIFSSEQERDDARSGSGIEERRADENERGHD